MSLLLCDLEVVNFRSIRGRLHAPLDAKVVLIHGENGAGKTSFLSAIELALTGRVQALRRADPNYTAQLLHRTASAGKVEVRTHGAGGPLTFSSTLNPSGISVDATLDSGPAGFFSERCYLPQSLLGQLLQIYQESDSGLDSPLARFVGSLLGLERLDTLEAGLKNLGDVRNVRKLASGWGDVEVEKTRLDRTLADKRKSQVAITGEIDARKASLSAAAAQLGLAYEVSSEDFADLYEAFASSDDEMAIGRLVDQQRQLDSIRREAERSVGAATPVDAAKLAEAAAAAKAEVDAWRAAHARRVEEVRSKIGGLLPSIDLPQELTGFHTQALQALRLEQAQASARSTRSAADAARELAARDELAIAEAQLDTIDQEIGRIGANSSGLGAALAELTSFISGDICPVCDRDYRELKDGPLVDHVHTKVRNLSGSAQRLLTLSRTRGEQQLAIEALGREINSLVGRQVEPRDLANQARETAALDAAISELEALAETVAEGARREAADVSSRRQLADHQARDLGAVAAMQTLRDFARANEQEEPAEVETVPVAAARLAAALAERIRSMETRLAVRGRGRETLLEIKVHIERRDTLQASIELDEASHRDVEAALERGQATRTDGLTIRNTVDAVRSAVIRQEFNERLNRLWRDLFVRLAPSEPFVPAFSIPEGNTQRLQPKLMTLHREGGDAGGTPGAMLSAGNLNTATLTLFLAMHMSVPTQLPWLILDDPVQSMDDVHIAHFAALLRTLSKQHDRQIMLAVHDRQLFEYLKLELSPAYPNDSLLTLELSRSPRRDTVCVANRLSFQEETALSTAA